MISATGALRITGRTEHVLACGNQYRVKILCPDGRVDVLLIPKVSPGEIVRDLSGNGRDLCPGPNGGPRWSGSRAPVVNFDAGGDFAKSLGPLPREPTHIPPRVCK